LPLDPASTVLADTTHVCALHSALSLIAVPHRRKNIFARIMHCHHDPRPPRSALLRVVMRCSLLSQPRSSFSCTHDPPPCGAPPQSITCCEAIPKTCHRHCSIHHMSLPVARKLRSSSDPTVNVVRTLPTHHTAPPRPNTQPPSTTGHSLHTSFPLRHAPPSAPPWTAATSHHPVPPARPRASL
jgi:hypothetical protein